MAFTEGYMTLVKCLALSCPRTNWTLIRIISHKYSDLTRDKACPMQKCYLYKGLGTYILRVFRGRKEYTHYKVPGSDGITAGILKLGGWTPVFVTHPLHRAVRARGLIPSDWNVTALQLIWKEKGRRDDVDKYRPIALASIFRKVLEKIIMALLQAIRYDLDVARCGLRKGRSTYDLILALDKIIKDRSRMNRPSQQAILDINGALTRPIETY